MNPIIFYTVFHKSHFGNLMLFFVVATNPDIQSSSLDMCKRYRYIHLECIGLDSEVTASGGWHWLQNVRDTYPTAANPENAEHLGVGCDVCSSLCLGEWYSLKLLSR